MNDALTEATAEVVERELSKQEMLLTDPLTLRRMMAQRIARAAIAVIAPAVLDEAAGVVLGDGNYRKNNRGCAYIDLCALKARYV